MFMLIDDLFKGFMIQDTGFVELSSSKCVIKLLEQTIESSENS